MFQCLNFRYLRFLCKIPFLSHLSSVVADSKDSILIDTKPLLLHLVPRNQREDVALHGHRHLKEDPLHGGELTAALDHVVDALLGRLSGELAMKSLHV